MSNLQQQIHSLLKGLRNGLQYGSKVRFVHTLVMTLLFKDVTLQNAPSLLKNILSMAIEHGKNLGLFVFLYKLGYKVLNSLIGKHSVNHLIAGGIFGGIIFGKKTGVNHQIVLYLLSRVTMSMISLLYKKVCSANWKGIDKIGWIQNGYGYYLLAAICWGIVMWMFEKDKSTLQPSLKHSMQFLYKESNTVNSLTQLIPFYPKDKNQVQKKEQIKHIRSIRSSNEQQNKKQQINLKQN